MASAFDGIGLGSMGFEKQFMTGDNPLREALKGLKTGMIVQGMKKSGLRDFLNPSSPSATGEPVIPPASSTSPVNPEPVAPSVNFAPAPTGNDLHNELDKEWGITPDQLSLRNPALDQGPLQMASQSVAPPGQMNLPQYGKQSGGGGLDLAMKILPMIFGV